MRIALVTPYDYSYPGGVTVHIKCLGDELRKMGHSVTIVAPSSATVDSLEENIVRISRSIWPVPFNGSSARISLSPQVYQRVKGVLRAGQFDVVHVHEPTVPVLPLAMLRHSNALNIGTFHAYREAVHLGYEYGKAILDPFLDRLDGRIAVSPAARDYIAEYFPAEYTIIPNGVDVERFGGAHVAPIERFMDGKLNILFVGRLDRRKGFRHLLRAYPAIKAAVPQARLIVVGAFSKGDRAAYLHYVRLNKLRDVRFVGYASMTDLARYYRTAHVFVAPSTGFESFGMVLLEAMAAGAPVVASSIAGYRSVITDGVDGLLVPPGSETALAETIVKLLTNPEQRAQLSLAGRQTAACYAWPRVAREVADYYTACLAHPSGAQRAGAATVGGTGRRR